MKRKVYCTIPQGLIKEPLLYTLGSQFQVVPNIRGASVTEEIALLTLEIEGDADKVGAAIQYLLDKGVQVEELDEEAEA